MPKATNAKKQTPSRSATKQASPKKAAAKKPAAKASPKAKPAAKPAAAKKSAAKKTAGDEPVTIDRRGEGAERRQQTQETSADSPALTPRKKVNRRRQIDPTTCERDYTDAEVQFMNAMDEYKRTSGRMFPTCSEVLEVIRSLGYVQLSAAEIAAREPAPIDETGDADEQATEEFHNEPATEDELLEEAESLLA